MPSALIGVISAVGSYFIIVTKKITFYLVKDILVFSPFVLIGNPLIVSVIMGLM